MYLDSLIAASTLYLYLLVGYYIAKMVFKRIHDKVHDHPAAQLVFSQIVLTWPMLVTKALYQLVRSREGG